MAVLSRSWALCWRSWAALGAYVGDLGPLLALMLVVLAALGPYLGGLGGLEPKRGRPWTALRALFVDAGSSASGEAISYTLKIFQHDFRRRVPEKNGRTHEDYHQEFKPEILETGLFFYSFGLPLINYLKDSSPSCYYYCYNF